nr:molybdopterin-binding protein [Acetomicrobium hydrogeniformans]
MKVRKKIVNLNQAINHILSHDLTKIDVDMGYKGPRFKKGHVIKEEDIEILRSMGKEHLTILELEEDEVHEDDAALALGSAICGKGLKLTAPSEGRCNLIADFRGLLYFDPDKVNMINSDPDWVVVTLYPYTMVEPGDMVAGFRILPLAVKRAQLERALRVGATFEVRAYNPLKVGLITTGGEIKSGIIKDAFRPKLERKVAYFGGSLLGQSIAGDDLYEIVEAIRNFLNSGADLIICTGGMSVDADDNTPRAIAQTCDEVKFKGIPVLPGSMLMVGMKGEKVIIGAPACVVHDEWTSLDLVLPRIFAGLIPTFEEISRFGIGGLCRRCSTCSFPNCSFGVKC